MYVHKSPNRTSISIMSDDLYGDLDTSTSALSRKEATELQRKAERESESLRAELAALQSANRELGRANEVLAANLSKVFATAQNEIQRKDKEIRRLRDALEAQERQASARAAHSSSSSINRSESRELHHPPSMHKSPTTAASSHSRHSGSERHR